MHVVQWHDKRIVSVLTTIYDDTPVPVQWRSGHAPNRQEVVEKPHAIVEYNKYKGGVDRGDQLLTYYGYPHRTRKWWRRAFFFLFDAAVVNSYIMYCQRHQGRGAISHMSSIELSSQKSSSEQPNALHHQLTLLAAPRIPRLMVLVVSFSTLSLV